MSKSTINVSFSIAMLNYQRVHTIIGESLYTGYWYFTVKMDDHPRLGTLDQTFEHGMCIFCVRFRAKKKTLQRCVFVIVWQSNHCRN